MSRIPIIIFRPADLSFWLACAKPGKDRESGAGYQKAHQFSLRGLLESKSRSFDWFPFWIF